MKEQITDSDAGYALEIVNRICDRVGPGLSDSSKEGERAAIIEKGLNLLLGEENVSVEKFSVSPFAFVSTYCVSAVVMVVAVLLNTAAGSGIFPMTASVSALMVYYPLRSGEMNRIMPCNFTHAMVVHFIKMNYVNFLVQDISLWNADFVTMIEKGKD